MKTEEQVKDRIKKLYFASQEEKDENGEFKDDGYLPQHVANYRKFDSKFEELLWVLDEVDDEKANKSITHHRTTR